MAVNLSPYGGVGAQFLDNAGNVLTGGRIETYAAGTTTPQAVYTDSTGITFHPNPIILDASGRVPSGGEIWLTDGLLYKFVLRDSNNVLIATYDNIVGINSNFVNFTNQQEIQTATAGQTVFTLTTTNYSPGTNSLSVFVDGVNQYGPGAQYSYLETNSTTVTFVNGLHVGALVKFTTSQLNSSGGTDASQVSYTPGGVGAVTTTVQAKLRETVSVKDFGAVGDGVADDTAEIQAAITYVGSLGGGTVFIPTGTYNITSPLVLASDVVICGEGVGNTILAEKVLTNIVRTTGTMTSPANNTLASNSLEGSLTITLASGGAAAFVPGEWLFLVAENLPFAGSAATQKQGEFCRIVSISGDVITVAGPILFDYTTANTAKVFKYTPVKNIGIENLTMTSGDIVNARRIFVALEYCEAPVIRNCEFKFGASTALYLIGCVNAIIDSCTSIDLSSSPEPFYGTAGGFGYFVAEGGPNINLLMTGCQTTQVRHTYTTVVGGGTNLVQPYGYPIYSKISSCTSMWSRAASFDTHPGAGYYIEFNDCYSVGSRFEGFQIRSERTIVNSCSISNSTGPAVYVTNYGSESTIQDCVAKNTNLGTDLAGNDWTTFGSYLTNGNNISWNNCFVENCGGPGFESLNGGGFNEIHNILIKEPCRLGASNKSAIAITGTQAQTLLIDKPYIDCSDSNMEYGVRSANANPNVSVFGAFIRGSTLQKYSIANASNLIYSGYTDVGLSTFGKSDRIDIVSGAINLVNFNSSNMRVEGEGGLADDLDNINGGSDGDYIILRRFGTNVTIKNGTGNIILAGSADFTLSATFRIITLVKVLAFWVEVSRTAP